MGQMKSMAGKCYWTYLIVVGFFRSEVDLPL